MQKLKKTFLITDERCGGSAFLKIINNNLKSSVALDPQTRTSTKFPEYKGLPLSHDLLEYLYFDKKIDLVKCSYKSYPFDDYVNLIDFCSKKGIKLILLHRANLLERALSLLVAKTTKNYGAIDFKQTEAFTLDLENYAEEISRYKEYYSRIKTHLDNLNYEYLFLDFDLIFNSSIKIKLWQRILNYIDIEESEVQEVINNQSFIDSLSVDYSFDTTNFATTIINYDELKKLNRTLMLDGINIIT